MSKKLEISKELKEAMDEMTAEELRRRIDKLAGDLE